MEEKENPKIGILSKNSNQIQEPPVTATVIVPRYHQLYINSSAYKYIRSNCVS